MKKNNPIKALANNWDLSQGRHPYIAKRPNLYRVDPFADNDVYEEYDIGMGFNHLGHNTFSDNTYAKLVDTDTKFPISPLFVRDLTGRVIYIGYGPEFKDKSQWQADPQFTFPHNCREVSSVMGGYELLENVFLTHFRALEMSQEAKVSMAGEPDRMAAGYYPSSNLYPYKLRVDSFYIDGWRIPQTEMVFTRTVGIHPENAKDAARSFIRSWDTRPEGQSYVEFHKEMGGAPYFQDLFEKGCTIIPAMGAKNGVRKVGRNFENLGTWPGRVIEGLHEIAEERDSDAPYGTILEIVRPGFVAGDQVEPAVVNISNGSGYEGLNVEDYMPYLPDLFLPHTRCSTSWGKVWVPTLPAHFEEPAIWGWDDRNGHFIQQKGPLWDPLHYYYASVPKIIESYDAHKDGKEWVAVPDEMKEMFHPVVAMKGFDTFSEVVRTRREDHNSDIRSAIHFVSTAGDLCDIGYHPLPVQCEYELDMFCMPDLSPKKRTAQDVPFHLAQRVLPAIESLAPLEDYKQSISMPEDAVWFHDESLIRASTFNPLVDYPQLYRYLGKVIEESIPSLAPVFLEDMPEEVLNTSVQDRWGSMEVLDKLDVLCPGFYDAFYSTQEKAKRRCQDRYRFYLTDRNSYVLQWWHCERWPEDGYVPSDDAKEVVWTSMVTPPTV